MTEVKVPFRHRDYILRRSQQYLVMRYIKADYVTFCLECKYVQRLCCSLLFVSLHSLGFTPFTAAVPTTASFKADCVTSR